MAGNTRAPWQTFHDDLLKFYSHYIFLSGTICHNADGE